MTSIKDLLQTADYKSEKHVPLIEAQDKVKKGEWFEVTVNVGKEIPHPNTTEHHISWIQLYFLPQGEKFPQQLGRFECSSHGASVQGPNTSTIYTQPVLTCAFKTDKPGTLLALSFCNIHGIWESSRELTLE
jgi:superoxide reductase